MTTRRIATTQVPPKPAGNTKPTRELRPGQLRAFATLPALLVAVVFTLGPLFIIIAYSFMSRPYTGGGVELPLTLEAYFGFLFEANFVGEVTFEPRYLNVLLTSFWQALITTVVCFALAFPLAVWIATRPESRQNILVLLVTIPFWSSLLVRTYAWMLILNDNGVVNTAASALGIGKLELLYTPFASQIGLIYTFLPFMVLPIYSSLAGFDFRLAEAAYDLGAKKWMVVRRVLLPMAIPGIISGVLLVFMPAFGSYVQPVLLGGGKLLLIGNLIAGQFGQSRNWPFGAALSVIILVMLALALIFVALYSRRSGRKVEISL